MYSIGNFVDSSDFDSRPFNKKKEDVNSADEKKMDVSGDEYKLRYTQEYNAYIARNTRSGPSLFTKPADKPTYKLKFLESDYDASKIKTAPQFMYYGILEERDKYDGRGQPFGSFAKPRIDVIYDVCGYDSFQVNAAGMNRAGINERDIRVEEHKEYLLRRRYGVPEPQESALEEGQFDRFGYNSNGKDKFGIDRFGFGDNNLDSENYDRFGFKDGKNRLNFGPDGFNDQNVDSEGYSRDGFRNGFDRNNLDRFGFGPDGFNAQNVDSEGYSRDGFRNGINRAGFGVDGFNDQNVDSEGYSRAGFKDGKNRAGFGVDGFNDQNVDSQGYSRDGFRNGRDRNGRDRFGFGVDGFNAQNVDSEGYSRAGFRDGVNREGYCELGYKNGFNRNGLNKFGVNRIGNHRIGKIAEIDAIIDDNCGICMEDLKFENQPVVILECAHMFHCECLNYACEQGNVKKCPYCRRDIKFNNVPNITEEQYQEILNPTPIVQKIKKNLRNIFT